MTKKLIAFIGRATIDHTYLLEDFPDENTKCFASNYLMQYGGPALNAAITCQLLGGTSTIYSCFGNNSNGKKAKKEMVDLYQLKVFDITNNTNYKLPSSSILVNKRTASRTIINSTINKMETAPNYSNIDFKPFDFILFDGYNFSPELKKALMHAKQYGSKLILDGGNWKQNTEDILPMIDYAICSQTFLKPNYTQDQTIKHLQNQGIGFIAFTNDNNSIRMITNSNESDIRIEQITAIDTLGAGDVLHGAFCYYLSENNLPEKALELASKVATASCKYFGTHSWSKK